MSPTTRRSPVRVVSPRAEERFAIAVIEQLEGAVFDVVDDGSEDRMLDGLFHAPDGELGALEVTTVGQRPALAAESLAAKSDRTIPGLRWAWIVWFEPGTKMKALRDPLEAALLECERVGVRSPDELPWRSAARRWYEGSTLRAAGTPGTARPGAVDVVPAGDGGRCQTISTASTTGLRTRLQRPCSHRSWRSSMRAAGLCSTCSSGSTSRQCPGRFATR
jgi:hypothetical protein